MIGKTILHYRILEKLGEGGMGVVYKAEDTKLKRTVAIKFLPHLIAASDEKRERFKIEAQAAAVLNHPNIATIHAIEEVDDEIFIVMEYIEGKELREIVGAYNYTPLPIHEFIDYATQIASGMRAAHEKDVTNRDIKSANIMITDKGQVKIMDFGLAKVRGGAQVTKTGTTLGTAAYMSPEQALAEEVDHRTDIWSFGVVLYEMLTGKLPFMGEHEQVLIYSILNKEPRPVSELREDVPEDLESIVNKCLEKEAKNRYQNIEDLQADLEQIKGEQKAGSTPVLSIGKVSIPLNLLTDFRRERKSSSEIVAPIAAKKRKPKRAIVVTAALTIVAVLVAFIFINTLQKQGEKPTPPRHTQLTFAGNVYLFWGDDGQQDLSAISPDGQFVAYVVPKDGTKSVMVQDISGGQPLEVFSDKTTNIASLKWAPDGAELMISFDYTAGNLIIPRLGGNAQRIAFYPYFSWSPDGSQIASTYQNWKVIKFIDKITSDSTSVIQLQGDFGPFKDIDWSPVGNRLAFLTESLDGKKTSIWTIKTDGSQQQKAIDYDGRLFSPRWSADGEAIYFLRYQSGGKDLMKIRISSSGGSAKSAPEILQTGLQAYGFTLSKDNRKMLYTRSLEYSNLWLVTFGNQNEEKLIQTNQLTTGTSKANMPRISPDGRKVAFILSGNVCVMPIAGGQIEQVTFFDSDCVYPCWSPDGEELAFANQNKVWRVRAKGGKPRPFSDTEVDLWPHLSWAPGSDILYQRPGNRNFHLLDPKTEAERPLLANDSLGWVFQPRYSPDGKNVAVYWNRRADRGLWLISLEDTSQTLLCNTEGFVAIEWSNDGKWLYARNISETPNKIVKIPASGGEPKTVATLPFEGKIDDFGLTMTPDGRCAVFHVRESVSDVWLLENFDPEVK